MGNRIDNLTLERIEKLHPMLRKEAKEAYLEAVASLTGKATLRFAYTLRTPEEQSALYAIGRTKPGTKVTNADAWQSYHNYGLAFDIVLLVDRNGDGKFEEASWDRKADFDNDGIADWSEVVSIFKRYGYVWGGDWKFTDPPHFEKSFGYSITQLNKMRIKNDVNGYVLL